jgi:16S rRNA (adenine(1408)-N(1))-methyltransferase
MLVVRGKQIATMSGDEVLALAKRYRGVSIDLGAGDGAFAYRCAKQHPERCVIAIDPVAENMREYSLKASRKLERGGLENLLYAVASVEQPPRELRALADELFVTLPWGSLMRGIILGDDAVLAGFADMMAHGGRVRIVLNTRIFDDPIPLEVRDLPDVTPDYVRAELASAFERHAMRIEDARRMAAEEVAKLGTTWAKRLSHRSPPRSVLIDAVKEE